MRENVRPLRLADDARADEPVQRVAGGSASARRWVPAAAAAVAFGAAFGLGTATKSSSSPQTATSLAPPVSIQAPRASVPALDREVQTPAPKARKPSSRPHTSPSAAPAPVVSAAPAAPAAPTTVAPTPHTGVTHSPTGVTHSPTGVVHSPGNGGTGGVVHGGN